jgi:hypothetical protein
MQNHIFRNALWTGFFLLIPLVAMQFTDEVNWTLSDFVVMGTLLFVVGLLIELAIRKAGKYRAIAIMAIVLGFLWLWAELAVGVFTNWGS